jgi:hypothetical protein
VPDGMGSKVRADAGNPAATERETDGHRSFVASHPQDTAGHAGGADLANLTLQSIKLVPSRTTAPIRWGVNTYPIRSNQPPETQSPHN